LKIRRTSCREKALFHYSIIRDAQYRYIKWSDTEDALYDHKNDKGEFYNLVESPEYKEVVARMRKELETFAKRK
jgi:hypothetical protein